MLSHAPWAAIGSLTFHIVVAVGLSLRVIMRRRTTEVALAWIILVVSFPVLGAVFYLLVGEPWLSKRRSSRRAVLSERIRVPISDIEQRFGHDEPIEHPAARAAAAIGHSSGLSPVIGGNMIDVLPDSSAFFDQLIIDIDSAATSCDMLFYIWSTGGRADLVADALIRAKERGVRCRVLLDGVGSKDVLEGPARRILTKAGVEVRAALPVGIIRGNFSRVDIRNHRKLVIIDDRVAFTGSQNMADPAIFKRELNVGPWVDLMTRIEGPAAAQLSALFELDWAMEDEHPVNVEDWFPGPQRRGDARIQVVPSGPGQQPSALYRMLDSAVHGAQERLVMTTPYFVPDQTFVTGLVSAAIRGVDTTVVVPEKIDGPLVRLASSAYYDELIDAGVNLLAYKGGLLHAKTLAVDDDLGVIGTVNLDRRSFWLNYELSLIVHSADAVRDLLRVQQGYIDQSTRMVDTRWMRRSKARKVAENTARLFSPLL
jgi:cardiolipin synthase